MKRKQLLAILLVLSLVLSALSANAGGLLPGLSDSYGVAMPSMTEVTGRYPDIIETGTTGETFETFLNVTEAEYNAFGALLGSSGCEMQDYTFENGVLKATVGKEGKTFLFEYDSMGAVIRLTYADGAYDERVEKAENDYKQAEALRTDGKWEEAVAQFQVLTGYRDAETQVKETEYQRAEALRAEGKWEEAVAQFQVLIGYRDAETQVKETEYQRAEALRAEGKWEEAAAQFQTLAGYRDAETQVRETKYQQAKSLTETADYDGAVVILRAIKDYKDVDDLLKNDPNLSSINALVDAAAVLDAEYKTGNYVTFGNYPQTEEGTDNTPIEWLVLARDEHKALLLSHYGLDSKTFEGSRYVWKNSELRTWLNDEFLNKAFNTYEQKAIITTNVDNSLEQHAPGIWLRTLDNTMDKVFLLSYAEAYKYLSVRADSKRNVRACVAPTAFAIKNGAYTDKEEKTEKGEETGWWMLRSPVSISFSNDRFGIVTSNGCFGYVDKRRINGGCLRPAIWVDLDEFELSNYIETNSNLVSEQSDDVESKAINETEDLPIEEETTIDYISFGTYSQTETAMESSPIEWLILAREGTKALLISRYGLDVKPYNSELTDITWEKCTLRTWLNNDFKNTAFNADEQKAILTTDVDNSYSQGFIEWRTNGGNNTRDQVFLLSYKEVNKYFGVVFAESNQRAQVIPTAYALSQGAETWCTNAITDEIGSGWWWLRSSGYQQNQSAVVYTDGGVVTFPVNDLYGCIRPALWVDLDLILNEQSSK